MTDHPIRLFESDAAVRRVGEGLLARTLRGDTDEYLPYLVR